MTKALILYLYVAERGDVRVLVVEVLLEGLVLDGGVVDGRQRVDVLGLEGRDGVPVRVVLDAHGLLLVQAAVAAAPGLGVLLEPSATRHSQI